MDWWKFLCLTIHFIVFGLCSVTATYHIHHITSRIINGTIASIEENPWVVSVRYKSVHRCGASIIGPMWILSAAHCVHSLDYNLFDVRVGSSKHANGGSILKFTDIIAHPKFDHGDHDIALFKLATPLYFTERIQPIALPNADDTFADGTECFVTGWGRTNPNIKGPTEILRRVSVPIVNWNYCKKQYNNNDVTEANFCAGYKEGLRDGCTGDSGGPLVTFVKGTPLLIGIVSSGEGCAKPGYPGIYTNVTYFRNWIKSFTDI